MDSPLRILHVVVNMNRGGAETLIMNLYRHIDRSRVQFDFLTCKKGSFDEEIKVLGGKIHQIPYITDGGPFKYNRALETFFKDHPEYKVVHSHLDKMSGFVLRAAKKCGVPVRIAHSHGTQSEGNHLAKLYKWYVGQLIGDNATHFLACSHHASQWLYGNKANQAKILNNGIDTDKYDFTPETRRKVREQFNLKQNDSLVVGHVGRFCTPKNHEFLIDIFNEILLFHPNAYLILAGDGPLKAKIKNKVENMGIDKRVLFLGVQENIHELLQAFDVMVFPSIHEGLPLTLIEAQSVGIPCLISNRISNEVDLGGELLKYESLRSSPKLWAARTLLMDGRNQNGHSFVKNKGYEIQQSARWIQNFYQTIGYVSGETG